MTNIHYLINNLTSGGAERVLSIIANNLASENCKVNIHSLGNDKFYNLNSNVFFRPLAGKRGFRVLCIFFAFIELRRRIKKENIQILQSHLFISNYINLLIKLLGGKQQVQLVHCVAWSSKYGGKDVISRMHRTLIKQLYRHADIHIFKSEAMRIDYEKITNIKKSVVIYNPCDFEYIKEKATPHEVFEGKNINLVAVGRFHPTKHQSILIEAISKLPPRVHLNLIGDGACFDEVKVSSQKLGISERVHFFGVLNNPFKIVAGSDIYVSASSSEGFPNSLIEAMSLGLPCIHSDCATGPREILIKDGISVDYLKPNDNFVVADFGLLFPVGNINALVNAIDFLINDPLKMESFGQKSKRRSQYYDINNIILSYKNLTTL